MEFAIASFNPSDFSSGASIYYPINMLKVMAGYNIKKLNVTVIEFTLNDDVDWKRFDHVHFAHPYDPKVNIKRLQEVYSKCKSFSMSIQDEYDTRNEAESYFIKLASMDKCKFVLFICHGLEKKSPSSHHTRYEVVQFYNPDLFTRPKFCKNKDFKLVHAGRVASRKKIELLLDIAESGVIPVEIWGSRVPGIHNPKLDSRPIFKEVYKGAFSTRQGDRPVEKAQFSWNAVLLNRGYNIDFAPRIEYSTVEALSCGTLPVLLNESIPGWFPCDLVPSLNYCTQVKIGSTPFERGTALLKSISKQNFNDETRRLESAARALIAVKLQSEMYNQKFRGILENVL